MWKSSKLVNTSAGHCNISGCVSIDTVANSFALLCTERQQKKVSLNTFLDTLMSDPPPQCLVWLPLMHRLANVENGKRIKGNLAGKLVGVGKIQSSSLHHSRVMSQANTPWSTRCGGITCTAWVRMFVFICDGVIITSNLHVSRRNTLSWAGTYTVHTMLCV